jgi:hypothetical protein
MMGSGSKTVAGNRLSAAIFGELDGPFRPLGQQRRSGDRVWPLASGVHYRAAWNLCQWYVVATGTERARKTDFDAGPRTGYLVRRPSFILSGARNLPAGASLSRSA